MNTASDLSAYLQELRTVIETALGRALPEGAAPALVIDAMHHGLMGGGKRLRPSLTFLLQSHGIGSRAFADGEQLLGEIGRQWGRDQGLATEFTGFDDTGGTTFYSVGLRVGI